MPTEPKKIDGALFGQVFHLDKFRGIEPGMWGVDWKAELNRTVVLMVGMSPKADKNIAFDLDAALAKLGYVKATELSAAAPDLLEACQAFAAWDEDPHATDPDASRVRRLIAAAIARATGKDSTDV